VTWKTELKLDDLDPKTPLEIACKRCGYTRYETQSDLISRKGLRQAYLDEVEKALRCEGRFCGGAVRISLIYDDKNEGFVGGMA
jgi:hypothetical protein